MSLGPIAGRLERLGSTCMKRLIVRMTIALGVLAVVAATALAAAVKHPSFVDIHVQTTPKLALFGTVRSDSARCEAGRKVQVLLGKTRSQSVVKTATTDHAGKWTVVLNPPTPGRYQAKATRQNYSQHGTSNICKPDKSDKLDVH